MRPLLALAALLLPCTSMAASISASGYPGGPDSGAATANPAAVHYNPAALAAGEGLQIMVDGYASFVRVDATTTRNDGIDPNTGEAYGIAQARVVVPVALMGVSYRLPDTAPPVLNRMAFGLGVIDAFVGGGDYTAGEPDLEAPWESHQRYAGVSTAIITLHVIPAVGVTVVDGVHVGGGFKYIFDSIDALQTADPLGNEGQSVDGPYMGDTILEGHATGHHFGWNAGVLVDKWRYLQVGASYTDNGDFTAEGEGSLTVPQWLGGGSPDAIITFDMPLPSIVHLWGNSQVTDKLMLGAGWEYQMWGECCGDHEGDLRIGVTSTDGDDLGEDPEDGITGMTVGNEQYSPRRLWNASNFMASAGYQATDRIWFGGKLGYHQNAVPNYAVSATNIDYESVGGMLAGRFQVSEPLTLGVTYAKYFLFDREITNSAWDVRDETDPAYRDEYFSPKNPYKASTNGLYTAKADMVGVRIDLKF